MVSFFSQKQIQSPLRGSECFICVNPKARRLALGLALSAAPQLGHRSVRRQSRDKLTAVCVGLGQLDLTAVLRGNPLRDGQTKAGARAELTWVISRAGFIGAIEPFKDVGLRLERNSGAGVADNYPQPGIFRDQSHADFAGRWSVLDRVVEQIKD